MAVVQQSIVGISSNPDPRPSFAPADVFVGGVGTDAKRNDVTLNFTGRLPVTYTRKTTYPFPKDVTAGP